MTNSRSLTQEQIDVLEEHLPYELDALEEGLSAWGTWAGKVEATRSEWYARISAIEAFWVHARLLQEFFTKDEERAASADHFTNGTVHYEIPDVEKIQQQIVHVNYGRPRGHDLEKLDYWFAQRFLGCVDRAVLRFQTELLADAKKYWKVRGAMTISAPSMTPQPTNAISAILSTLPKRGPVGPDQSKQEPYSGFAPTLPAPPRENR